MLNVTAVILTSFLTLVIKGQVERIIKKKLTEIEFK